MKNVVGKKTTMAESAVSQSVYQFKIALSYSKPKIWRRIQVPKTYSFKDLHLVIQKAMGWQNCHLHEFEINYSKTRHKIRIGNKANEIVIDDSEELISEDEAKIDEYFLTPKDKAIYEYDFGDGWRHEVVLEKILPAVTGVDYPKCIGGKRACPPEDSGGVEGYEELLEIRANPKHKEYAETMEWLDRMRNNFDPEEFDAKLVQF